MMPLFDKASLVVLESLSFTKTLYAFDFDGTLARIVRDPSAAYMAKTTEELLSELSDLVPVAIVSGRSVEDLKARLPFTPKYAIGNHGLEGLGDVGESASVLEKSQKISAVWKNKLSQEQFDYGVEIEDKTYSLAIHFRKSRKKSLAKTQIKTAIDLLTPTPHLILGKCVFNLIPPGAPHKGTALSKLMQLSGLKYAFYIGDDDTDEDIFSFPYRQGQLMSVRVGKKSKSSASYYIDRQSEVNRLLRLLIRYHATTNNKAKMD